jgi:predicted acyl esterase
VKAKSSRKWLYTHRTGKWDVYYSAEVQRLTKDFMDCFLKDDTSSGFLERAPVRLEVRSSRDVVHAVRDEREWPLPRTDYTKLFLVAEPRALDRQSPPASRSVAHPARRGHSAFAIRFDRDTELTGHMKLRLWLQAKAAPGDSPPPGDMAIFVAVNKLDEHGRTVRFRGSVGNPDDMVTRGFCRVSRRELDPKESTEYQPVLTGTSHQPLEPNQTVPVEIELYPSSTFFAAGESLELIVSANEIIPSPPYRKDVSFNRGIHVIHCGGDYDSYLLVRSSRRARADLVQVETRAAAPPRTRAGATTDST